MKKVFNIAIISSLCFLTSCGGGNNNNETNEVKIVSAVEEVAVEEEQQDIQLANPAITYTRFSKEGFQNVNIRDCFEAVSTEVIDNVSYTCPEGSGYTVNVSMRIKILKELPEGIVFDPEYDRFDKDFYELKHRKKYTELPKIEFQLLDKNEGLIQTERISCEELNKLACGMEGDIVTITNLKDHDSNLLNDKYKDVAFVRIANLRAATKDPEYNLRN